MSAYLSHFGLMSVTVIRRCYSGGGISQAWSVVLIRKVLQWVQLSGLVSKFCLILFFFDWKVLQRVQLSGQSFLFVVFTVSPPDMVHPIVYIIGKH